MSNSSNSGGSSAQLVPVLVPLPDVLSKVRVTGVSQCAIERDAQRGGEHVLVLRGDTTHARVQVPRECRPCSLLSLRCALLTLQLRLAAVEHFALELTLRLDGHAACRLCIATHVKTASYDARGGASSDAATMMASSTLSPCIEARLPLIVPRGRWVQVIVHVDGIMQHIFRQPPLRSIDVVALAGTARVGRVMASNDEQACIDATPPTLVLFAVPAYTPPIWRTATAAAGSTQSSASSTAKETHALHHDDASGAVTTCATTSSPRPPPRQQQQQQQQQHVPHTASPLMASQRTQLSQQASARTTASSSSTSSLPSLTTSSLTQQQLQPPSSTPRMLAPPARLQPLAAQPPQQQQQRSVPLSQSSCNNNERHSACAYVRFVDYAALATATTPPQPPSTQPRPQSSSYAATAARLRAMDVCSTRGDTAAATATSDAVCSNDVCDDAVCAWAAAVRVARASSSAASSSSPSSKATRARATHDKSATRQQRSASALANGKVQATADEESNKKARTAAAVARRRARAVAAAGAASTIAVAALRRTASSHGRDGNNNTNMTASRARNTVAASVARVRRCRARRRLRLLRANARQLQRAYNAAGVCASDVSLYDDAMLGRFVYVSDDAADDYKAQDEHGASVAAAAAAATTVQGKCTASAIASTMTATTATLACNVGWWRAHEPHCGYGFGYLGVLHDNGDYDVDTAADLHMKGALSLQLSDDDEDADE